MFSSLNTRILLGIYILVIISIPIGAYFASAQTTFKSKAQEVQEKKTTEVTKSSPTKSSPAPTISPTPTKQLQKSESDSKDEGTVATAFGPTLSLKVIFEGRGKDNQSGTLFVGISEGIISINPKFLLSFTIDLPKTGEYSNLSLAGLNPGTKYSALLKGSAQIASASAFIMSPTVSNLGDGAITLLSGDLNEDNTVNSQDYSIVQKAFGSNSKSSNWVENADFNKDGVINSLDLAILNKNFGKIGDSGSWTSPLPKTATASASINGAIGSPESSGYWIWVPKLTN